MTACVRGCVVPLAHATGCSCGSDGHHHDGTCDNCAGCLPAEADLGLLCRSDIGRIRRALDGAPELAGWIREQVPPGAPTDAPRVTGTREPPAPLSLTALDDADDIAALLWGHAEPLIETGLVGPSTEGLRIRPRDQRLTAPDQTGRRDVIDIDPAALGLRLDADPVQVISNVAGWLSAHLAELAALEGAGDIHDDITERLRTLSNRWTREDRNRKLPLPCPQCDLAVLYLHPPAGPPARDEHGGIVWAHQHLVHCHNDDCNAVMTHDSYYLAATVAVAERKAKGRAA